MTDSGQLLKMETRFQLYAWALYIKLAPGIVVISQAESRILLSENPPKLGVYSDR